MRVRYMHLRLAFYAAVFAATSHGAHAADGFRCGSKLVLQGAIGANVRTMCGDPQAIERSVILRRPSYMRDNRVVYIGEQAVEAVVETWTYNFGPNKLMQRLRFVDGVLEDIESLGYGHHLRYDRQ